MAANDDDSTTPNNRKFYQILSGIYSNLFAIDSTSGQITVNGRFYLLYEDCRVRIMKQEL